MEYFDKTRKKRILNEYKKISKNPPYNCSVRQDKYNINYWEGEIFGPLNTPYANKIYKIKIKFPNKYPMKPPKIKFISKIRHPNISLSGKICINILSEDWNSKLTIENILISICSLISKPNPFDPFDKEMAYYYLNDPVKYMKIVNET